MSNSNRGLLMGISAYAIWGVAPLFWHILKDVPALEIFYHRALWSAVLMSVWLTIQGNWGWFAEAWRSAQVRRTFLLSATLLTINWLTYIWAVNNHHAVESSLGYFINPLVNVLLGMVFLRERLRRWQWVAVGLATLGVGWLTWQVGKLPWIALTLAFSFGVYGLLRKTAPLNSAHGLTFETMLISVVSLIGIGWLVIRGENHFNPFSPNLLQTSLLLIFSGFVTAFPLLVFAAAARRLPLSAIGLLQYLAPTMQFAIGVWVFHEPFDMTRLQGFLIIWLALLVYIVESIQYSRKKSTSRG